MTTGSILYLILNIVSTIVGLSLGGRAIVKILGLNQNAPVIQWIMRASETFVSPFRGLLQDVYISSSSIIDLTAILALIIYAIVFSLLYRLVARAAGTVIETDANVHSV